VCCLYCAKHTCTKCKHSKTGKIIRVMDKIEEYFKNIENAITNDALRLELRELQKYFRESEEMHKAKDKVFSVLSHDLRGSIANLISINWLTIESEEDTELKMSLLKDATAQLEMNFEMVDNLLRWAKSQMRGIIATPSFFDIQEESQIVTEILQHMAIHKQITLTNLIEKQRVYVDRDFFNVILRNLTTNALKYTSPEGEVTLTSELKDKMLVIAVKDNGTGMSAEVQEKLFKLSENNSISGTNNEKGMGLGLILCADFVRTIGGQIWFTTEQGKGSTFYFSIPLTN